MSINWGASIVQILAFLLPLILVAFMIRWIRVIKINSDMNNVQNKKIISLLEEIKRKF